MKTQSAINHRDLLAPETYDALAKWEGKEQVLVVKTPIELLMGRLFCAKYQLPAACGGKCMIITATRRGKRYAGACVVSIEQKVDLALAAQQLRADVIRFLPLEETLQRTGMEYGSITPIGLPTGWPILLDTTLAEQPQIVVGSGRQSSKLLLPSETLVRNIENITVISSLGYVNAA